MNEWIGCPLPYPLGAFPSCIIPSRSKAILILLYGLLAGESLTPPGVLGILCTPCIEHASPSAVVVRLLLLTMNVLAHLSLSPPDVIKTYLYWINSLNYGWTSCAWSKRLKKWASEAKIKRKKRKELKNGQGRERADHRLTIALSSPWQEITFRAP